MFCGAPVGGNAELVLIYEGLEVLDPGSVKLEDDFVINLVSDCSRAH